MGAELDLTLTGAQERPERTPLEHMQMVTSNGNVITALGEEGGQAAKESVSFTLPDDEAFRDLPVLVTLTCRGPMGEGEPKNLR